MSKFQRIQWVAPDLTATKTQAGAAHETNETIDDITRKN
jgi:hypothetical protein